MLQGRQVNYFSVLEYVVYRITWGNICISTSVLIKICLLFLSKLRMFQEEP